MLLTVDVGNTNMVFGIYEGDELLGSFRLSTNIERTSDEIGMKIHAYYGFLGLHSMDTEAAIIASVVPPIMHTLVSAVMKYVGVKPLIVGEDIEPGIQNCYENPKEVGVDRLVNAVSAIHKYGAPLLIIDMGTATTFDAVSYKREYLGGVIFPGIRLAMEALFMKTAKLPKVDIAMPPRVIGRNTVSSMQSGAVWGYVGAILGIAGQMIGEMEQGEKVKVIATGGMGRMMAEYCQIIDHVDSNLTLEGLRLIYQRGLITAKQ